MVCEGWEGNTVDGRFPLLEWVGGWADFCVFLTVRQRTQKANIKLILASGDDAEAHLANWEVARTLSHPFLVQLMESGRYTIQDSDVVYLVTEKTDAFLSGVIPRKALDPADVKIIFDPILDALSFLHGKGLAHGCVRPSNIVQVGEQWKLASDEMAGSGEFAEKARKPDVYDAPEVAEGTPTPAADVWSLGIIAVEAFSQRTPVWDRDAKADLAVPEWVMPEPFLEMARGCLRWQPADRISVEDAKALLARYRSPSDNRQLPADEIAPVPVALEPRPDPKNDEEVVAKKTVDSYIEPERVVFAPRSRMFTNLEAESEHTGRKGSVLVAFLVLLAIVAVLAVRFRGRLFSAGETRNVPTESQSAPPKSQAPQNEVGSGQSGSSNANQPAAPGQTQNSEAPNRSAETQNPPPNPSSRASQPTQSETDLPAAPPKEPAQSPQSEVQPATKPEPGASESRQQEPRTSEANSRGAVVKRVLPNIEPGASVSMRRAVDVELRVSVDEEGRVSNVEYMTRGPGNYFARKAREAAESWKFRPPESDGQPAASQWVLLFRFERRRANVTATELH